VRLARNLRFNVDDRSGKLTAQQQAEFKSIADRMMSAVTANENEVYQTKNQSMQDPLNYPIKLNNKIAALAGTVSSGEYRPTRQSREVFTELATRLDAQTRAMNKAIDDNLPRLNAILRAAGLPELRKSFEEIKPQKPPVAM
jgi:phage-related minor tail protein